MKAKLIGFGVVALLLGTAALSGFTVVETGHRGVKATFGKVESESLPEGLYIYNPFMSKITQMDIRQQRLDHSEIAYTKDIQQATIAYTVNYGLRPDHAHTVLQEVGADWAKVLVPQVVSGTIKGVIGSWNAVELISNRNKATADIEAAIKAALADRNVSVSKFEITNIDYNDEFEKAVEAKVTATERAKEAENKTRQVQEEAKQRIISAEAEARSMQIRSEALTQNHGLVEYEAVHKWDGKLPQYMLGNGALPFINVGKTQ